MPFCDPAHPDHADSPSEEIQVPLQRKPADERHQQGALLYFLFSFLFEMIREEPQTGPKLSSLCICLLSTGITCMCHDIPLLCFH